MQTTSNIYLYIFYIAMAPATSTQTRQVEILQEERGKVEQRLDRLNDMLDGCDDETATGLEELRSVTREQLDELDQQLERLR